MPESEYFLCVTAQCPVAYYNDTVVLKEKDHNMNHTGGQCLTKNPAGRCCRPAVHSVIARSLERRQKVF